MRLLIVSFYLILIGTNMGCEEANPYAGGVATGSVEKDKDNKQGQDLSENIIVADGQDEVAEDLSEEAISITEAICQSAALFDANKASFDAACVDGKASVALANALENPYDGTGEPNLNLLRNDDIDRVSYFLVLSAVKVAVTPEEVLAQANTLNETDIVEDNVTITQTELLSTPGDSGPVILSTEIEFILEVDVGITVTDTRILTREFIMVNEELGIIGYRTHLKAGNEDNEDNILADMMALYIPVEGGSILVGISEQHARNRGRHETALDTFTKVGTRMAKESVATFSK